MEKFDALADTLVVGQKIGDSDERVILFCKMKPGRQLDNGLVESIKNTLKTELSPRHVPAVIMPIAEIPVYK